MDVDCAGHDPHGHVGTLNSVDQFVEDPCSAAHDKAIARQWLPGKSEPRGEVMPGRRGLGDVGRRVPGYARRKITRVIIGHDKSREAASRSSRACPGRHIKYTSRTRDRRGQGHTGPVGTGNAVRQCRKSIPLPPDAGIHSKSRGKLYIILDERIDVVETEHILIICVGLGCSAGAVNAAR